MSGFKSYKIRDGVHIPSKKYKEGWDAIFNDKKKSTKGDTMDENEPKKFIIEFTTKTHADVVKQDFEKIKKFIEENVGNITKEITLKD
jgi:hypothetical protein